MSRPIVAVALLSLALAGCDPLTAPSEQKAVPPELPTQQVAAGRRAVITQGPTPDSAVVEYHNDSPHEIVVDPWVITAPYFCLEVFNSSGQRMPPGMWPGNRPERDPVVRIPHGRVHCEEYFLIAAFDLPVRPGRYWVRVHGWACEPMEYVVNAK